MAQILQGEKCAPHRGNSYIVVEAQWWIFSRIPNKAKKYYVLRLTPTIQRIENLFSEWIKLNESTSGTSNDSNPPLLRIPNLLL